MDNSITNEADKMLGVLARLDKVEASRDELAELVRDLEKWMARDSIQPYGYVSLRRRMRKALVHARH